MAATAVEHEGDGPGFEQMDFNSFLKVNGRIYHRIFPIFQSNVHWFINDSSNHFGEDTLNKNGMLKLTENLLKIFKKENKLINDYCILNSIENIKSESLVFEKCSELTLTWKGEGSEKPKIHALVIPKDLKSPIQIPIFNHSYEPLTFPLLYPTGNPGYIFKTKTEKNGDEEKAETFREYLKNKLLFIKQNN
jgi:hypothetical protein